MEQVLSLEGLTALITLIFLEIVLGIDNVIFISIVANKLPGDVRQKAWRLGLVLALVIRVFMLCTISWMMEFNKPLISFIGSVFSLRDIILFIGGLFLVYKSTIEINHEMSPSDQELEDAKKLSFHSAVLQIVFVDLIFSFDSILTAVGLSNILVVMIGAVVVSMIVMMFFLDAISTFIKRHHSMEILALAFLILIGFILILESFHYQIPKGYVYFAVGFAFSIELISIRKRNSQAMNDSP